MRLNNTVTGQFRWADDPSTVTYAIFSHVWQKLPDGTPAEQTHQDEKVQSEQEQNSSLPFNEVLYRLSPKLRNACRRAREDGFIFLWVDTCCIDKTSSVELSEAINSMYAWYGGSAVCYIILYDVHAPTMRTGRATSARASGSLVEWTLQELIAPRDVVFLGADWVKIGTKTELLFDIERITGIDADVLFEPSQLTSISVARRMSWASMRVTTRKEDEAYSLMGIFGINIATIYGEGEKAFFRPQQEILLSIPDQGIFVWDTIDSEEEGRGAYPERAYTLLAPSPKSFAHSASVIRAGGQIHDTSDPGELAFGFLVPRPTYLVTAYGIQARLPFYRGFSLSVTDEDISTERRLIPLGCIDNTTGQHLGLVLRGPFEASSIYPLGFGTELEMSTTSPSSVASHPPSLTAHISGDGTGTFRRGVVRFACHIMNYRTTSLIRFPRVGTFFIAHHPSQICCYGSNSKNRAPVRSDEHTAPSRLAVILYHIIHVALMWHAPFTSPFFPPLCTDLGRPPRDKLEASGISTAVLFFQLVFTQILPYAVLSMAFNKLYPRLDIVYGDHNPFQDIVFVTFRIGLVWNSWRLFYLFDLLRPFGIILADAILLPNQGWFTRSRTIAYYMVANVVGSAVCIYFLYFR